MEKQAEEQVLQIFADHFGMDKKDIGPSMELARDLNLSAIEMGDFMVILENTFHIEIPKEESNNAETLADVINIVVNHGNFT